MFTPDLDLAAVVHHDASHQRFEAVVDGLSCVADYRLSGSVVTFTHTGVPRALQGRGVAAELVRSALDWVRAEGLTVVPACSYVHVYMQRHPATQDLLAQRPPR
ncbi:MAG: GNAT family N-acetyltransferase [Leptothrix sp. (in: b-proteobacteria)]